MINLEYKYLYIYKYMQIFKKIIPIDILIEYLSKNGIKRNSYYEFNEYSFKKSQLNDSLNNFLTNIKEYYHESKKKIYLTRDVFKYKNITTIIRQICNTNNISFCSKLKYIKNTYDIIYFVYL